MTDNLPEAVSSRAEVTAAAASPTLIEVFEESPAGAQEMAAARFAVEVVSLLGRAIDETEISQSELASALEVTDSAISQVVNGDGNLRVATIGKYFRAMGYQPRLFLEPVEADRHVLVSRATQSAITDELSKLAPYLRGLWAITWNPTATSQESAWEPVAFGALTSWHAVSLPPATSQQTGARTP